MAFALHPGKKNKVRTESERDSPKNNLFSSSPQSETWSWSRDPLKIGNLFIIIVQVSGDFWPDQDWKMCKMCVEVEGDILLVQAIRSRSSKISSNAPSPPPPPPSPSSHISGFVWVMENLESHGILQYHFPGLESHGILQYHFPRLESHGILQYHFPRLESHGILQYHFPGLESHGILQYHFPRLESHGILQYHFPRLESHGI